jgi:hypothetical protein
VESVAEERGLFGVVGHKASSATEMKPLELPDTTFDASCREPFEGQPGGITNSDSKEKSAHSIDTPTWMNNGMRRGIHALGPATSMPSSPSHIRDKSTNEQQDVGDCFVKLA